MFLYYYKDPNGNFGDDLNQWLWNTLLPDIFNSKKDSYISGIGTLLHQDMPDANKIYVFSSGAGGSFLPNKTIIDKIKFCCVRGPLTEKVFNLPKSTYVTDGAILLANLPEYSPLPESERKGVVFMPHHLSVKYGNWDKVCNLAGIEYINPQWNSKYILERLRSAKLVLADAMHGAIVADTLRVPWIPIIATPKINFFKWIDWTLSMDLPWNPIVIPSSSVHEKFARFMLSPPPLIMLKLLIRLYIVSLKNIMKTEKL